MLITKNNYYERLLKSQSPNKNTYLKDYLSNKSVSVDALRELHAETPLPVIEFYDFLSKKLHKVIKETLDDRPRQVSECIKTVTSLITQATITLEKQFANRDVVESNDFIECVGLKELAESLSTFFNSGDSNSLENELKRVKEDILLTNTIINND